MFIMPASLKQWPHSTSLYPLIPLALSLLLILGGGIRTAYASGSAPNGPGASSVWTPSNNTILQRCPKRLSHSLALPFLWREIAAVHKPAVRILGGHGQQALGDRFFQGLSRASLAAS